MASYLLCTHWLYLPCIQTVPFILESITVLYIFLASSVIQIGVYLMIFGKLAFYSTSKKKYTTEAQPISVIICARNEADNLSKNLPLILEQDYHQFEVIVINDHSTDSTDQVLEGLKQQHDKLKTITLDAEASTGGKKPGITEAISQAKYDLLLLTDADCQPASERWIKSMQRNFIDEKDIVLGFSFYRKKSNLLNLLIRFDTFYTALQYFSFALLKIPYMGVGRNLAYRKVMFERMHGFGKHLTIPFGDDDLFINRAAKSTNTTIELDPSSFTISDPKSNFKEWFSQKIRHTAAGKYYRNNHKTLLGLIFLSQLIFYYSLIFLICSSTLSLEIVWILFFLRLFLQLTVFGVCMNRLKENIVLWIFSPLLDFLYLGLVILFTVSNLLVKEIKWK